MRIVARPHFGHAGNLVWPFGSPDPREIAFSEAELELDLRKCEFILPAAVLWCAVYPLVCISRGSKCRLLVPENEGVCIYLKTLGLFETLQANGVELDDRDIFKGLGAQIVVPLTRFDTESEVEDLANLALDVLSDRTMGSANVRPLVTEIFAELALNAVQHAESGIGSYGLIQFYESGDRRRFVCVVGDGGMGIRRSLEKNPEFRSRVPYDWVAIELAMMERVSGTGDRTRGIGLYGVAEDMRKAGRQLIIHSGIGALQIDEDLQSQARRTRLFPGTLAYASIPT